MRQKDSALYADFHFHGREDYYITNLSTGNQGKSVLFLSFSTNKMCHTKQSNKGLQGTLGNFFVSIVESSRPQRHPESLIFAIYFP